MVGGADIDADALAQSFVHGLRGYRLIGTSSQLISIDSTTGAAAHIGSALTNRTMRAAGFDALDRLWVVDAANNVLLRIDPVTGGVLGSAIPLTLGMSGFTISDAGSDLAFQANGSAVLVNSNPAYSLNIATGALALLFQDAAPQTDLSPVFYVGAAFVAGAGGGKLFAFDVNGSDDVYFYQNLSTPRVLYDEDFSPAFNAGRGDLASLPSFIKPGRVQVQVHTWQRQLLGPVSGYIATTIAEVPSIGEAPYTGVPLPDRWTGERRSAGDLPLGRVPVGNGSDRAHRRVGRFLRRGGCVPGRHVDDRLPRVADHGCRRQRRLHRDPLRRLARAPGLGCASETLIGAARTGQAVVVTCDTIAVAPCGDVGRCGELRRRDAHRTSRPSPTASRPRAATAGRSSSAR